MYLCAIPCHCWRVGSTWSLRTPSFSMTWISTLMWIAKPRWVCVHFHPLLPVPSHVVGQDRVHRMGQTKPVTVYRLVCSNTIDDALLQIQQRKAKLHDAVLKVCSWFFFTIDVLQHTLHPFECLGHCGIKEDRRGFVGSHGRACGSGPGSCLHNLIRPMAVTLESCQQLDRFFRHITLQ